MNPIGVTASGKTGVNFGRLRDARCRRTGHDVTSGESRPLPVGSSLDAATGDFVGAPGPGFIGTCELVFVRTSCDGARTRIPVPISIGAGSASAVALSVECPRRNDGPPTPTSDRVVNRDSALETVTAPRDELPWRGILAGVTASAASLLPHNRCP